jgi:predicted nucleotide-binding protein with TIR-like domain
MAKRISQPPVRPPMSVAELRASITRFRRRITDLEGFEPESVHDRSDPRIRILQVAIDEALSETFGHRTPEYIRYRAAASLDTAPHFVGHQPPLREIIAGLIEGKERSLALLQQAIRSFEEKLVDLEVPFDPKPGLNDLPAVSSNEVFIVHGRDSAAKSELALFIERAGLKPIILHEQPNAGRTIIEKFEDHGGSAGFAVILLTPDDVGGPTADKLQPRARQNVIGEMFWFAGKLGRKRVCALKKGDLEISSDFAGVAYTEMDDRGAWKAELLKELTAAGYHVDWAKAHG